MNEDEEDGYTMSLGAEAREACAVLEDELDNLERLYNRANREVREHGLGKGRGRTRNKLRRDLKNARKIYRQCIDQVADSISDRESVTQDEYPSSSAPYPSNSAAGYSPPPEPGLPWMEMGLGLAVLGGTYYATQMQGR